MKIHEYQAKEILRARGVPLASGVVVCEGEDAAAAAAKLPAGVIAVKAQIHAGGRGKGSVSKGGEVVCRGVQIARSAPEAVRWADSMMGGTLVTHQTGPEGKRVGRVFLEEGTDVARELYLGAILDRETARIVFMASCDGGMDIEKVAAETPERIVKVPVSPTVGLQPFQCRSIAYALGLSGPAVEECAAVVRGIFDAFVTLDCSLVEINPLVVTKGGGIRALDAKMNFDDNALFRHPEVIELRDPSEEAASEREASEYDLTYIRLDGNIGCMVNGAGLAMATMDIIKSFGGNPANFLDVGGRATPERVAASFRIILKDKVDGIFVNIFGGIVRCDVIADGIVQAVREVSVSVPVVVRLQGTNAEKGSEILRGSGLAVIPASTMRDGAQKIVEACRKAAWSGRPQ